MAGHLRRYSCKAQAQKSMMVRGTRLVQEGWRWGHTKVLGPHLMGVGATSISKEEWNTRVLCSSKVSQTTVSQEGKRKINRLIAMHT